ncbi:YopX family protein [Loigolactobacillus coryniformis]|uniref:YopX family protein n=1 Tax=Loigolactobacillus coryniformis TaxID=1610 RepID=UPI00234154BF|nr:YopX family protein [Loigolactobacillus coryniformis]MDC4184539.1 YopX family protein [Loigolactobacillus coryniformis]
MVPKFRAWHMPFGPKEPMQEMVHGKASSILAFAEMSPDKYIVEQSTGLKDANGKEIYEGDIIKFFGANKKIKAKNEFGIIIYKADRYGAGFNSIIQNKEHGYGGINIAQDIVVGNVHTNPELLE